MDPRLPKAASLGDRPARGRGPLDVGQTALVPD
jgi:hypothetical protein